MLQPKAQNGRNAVPQKRSHALLLKPGRSFHTLEEAAARIGTTPEKVNDIFRGRRSHAFDLRFDFRRHPVRIRRAHWRPPILDEPSVRTIGEYFCLKNKLEKGRLFRVSHMFSRIEPNMRLISDFAFSHAVLGEGCPRIPLLRDSMHPGLHVHELNGTIYTLNSIDAELLVSCARLLSGNRHRIAAEVNAVGREVDKYSAWEEFPPELQVKLWFLREFMNAAQTKQFVFRPTYAEMHGLLSTDAIEQLFAKTAARFFKLPPLNRASP